MAEVKTIGRSGQISLGKEFAGRHVLLDKIDSGVWMLKLGDFVPDNERWLHQSPSGETLDRAITWAESHRPKPTDLSKLKPRRAR